MANINGSKLWFFVQDQRYKVRMILASTGNNRVHNCKLSLSSFFFVTFFLVSLFLDASDSGDIQIN